MAVYTPYQLQIRGLQERFSYRLPVGRTRIGRNPGNEIVLLDAQVSQWHAEITCEQQGENWRVRIKDTDSTNGTILNSEPLRPQLPAVIRNPITGNPVDSRIQIASYTINVQLFGALPREMERDRPEGAEAQSDHRLYPYPYAGEVPFGLSPYSRRLLPYLPDLYQPSPEALLIMARHNEIANRTTHQPADQSAETFLVRFLALFESVLLPLESVADHFDLYLDPKSAPREFLPWLERWYDLPFFARLTEAQQQEVQLALSLEQRRALLRQAHDLFARKGTGHGLLQLLKIFCRPPSEEPPEISIEDEETDEDHFIVNILPLPTHLSRETLAALIEAYKPVHTTYELNPEANADNRRP